MPPVKVLARDWKFEINTGTDAAPTWVQIKGVNTFSPDSSKNDADTTDFDDEGWQAHIPASRGKSLTIQGLYLLDPDTGARDPGQEALVLAAELVGPEGLKPFRITDPGGNTTTGTASVDAKPTGGGNDDATGFDVALTFSGKTTFTPATP